MRRLGRGVDHRDFPWWEGADEVIDLDGKLEVHDFALGAARPVVDRELLQQRIHARRGAEAVPGRHLLGEGDVCAGGDSAVPCSEPIQSGSRPARRK